MFNYTLSLSRCFGVKAFKQRAIITKEMSSIQSLISNQGAVHSKFQKQSKPSISDLGVIAPTKEIISLINQAMMP